MSTDLDCSAPVAP